MQLIIFLILGLLLLQVVGACAGMIFETTGPVGCLVAVLLVLFIGAAIFH
jgi:hypothetical protein